MNSIEQAKEELWLHFEILEQLEAVEVMMEDRLDQKLLFNKRVQRAELNSIKDMIQDEKNTIERVEKLIDHMGQ